MPRPKFGQRTTVYSSGGVRQSPKVDADELKRRAARAARFRQVDSTTKDQNSPTADEASEVATPERYVKGTCSVLEKDYLRLTAPARAESVRPPSVLSVAFNRLQQKLRYGRPWEYISGQLRAIRQDMKVQGLDGSQLSLDVYTTNARWALESQDLVQFIQCLSAVTRQIHTGSVVLSDNVQAEFLAYEIVYSALQGFQLDQMRCLRRLRSIPRSIREHNFIRSALRLRSWAALGDYYRILKVYESLREQPRRFGKMLPSHMLDLLEIFSENIRLRLLRCLTKAYMQLKVSVISKWLRFPTEGDCRSFLSHHDLPHDADVIVCKQCNLNVTRQVQALEGRTVG